MKNNRYFRLQTLDINTFDLEAPIEIEKGALLLDTLNKAAVLQLRLNILGYHSRDISSVRLKIDCFDDAGEEILELNPFRYVFRDVYLNDSQSFGDKTPIVLDHRARSVNVEIERVVFTDKHIWFPSDEKISPQKQETLGGLSKELREQLNRDLESLQHDKKEWAVFFPRQEQDYWLCACGRPNKNDSVRCGRCGVNPSQIFSLVNIKTLTNNLDAYQERMRIASDEFDANEKRLNTRWRNVNFILAGIGLTSLFIIHLLIPSIKYYQAKRALENKDFDTAIVVFDSLGEFLDSPEMAKETNYQKANNLLQEDQFDEAITIFSSMENYKDSPELVNEANYQKAKDLLAQGKFDEVIEIINNIIDYKDAETLLKETKYQKATTLMENGELGESLAIFDEIKGYKEANLLLEKYEKLIPSAYVAAVELFNQGKFNQALSIFIQLGTYQDTEEYIKKIRLINDLRSFEWQGRKIIRIDDVVYRKRSASTSTSTYFFNPQFDENIETITFKILSERYIYDGSVLINETTGQIYNKGQEIDVEALQ